MSNNAPRTSRARSDSSAPVPGLDLEPLAHVLLALAVSAASLLLAYWTLWPGASAPPLPPGEVLAAEGRQALPERPAEERVAAATRTQRVAHGAAEPAAAEEATATAALAGRTLDEWARPVPHAEVWIEESGWHLATHSDHAGAFALSDATGAWRERLQHGEALRLGARAAGHGPALITELRSLDAGSVDLVLRGPGAALRIEVHDASGLPVPGARLELSEPLDEAGDALAIVTGEGGSSLSTPVPTSTTDARGVALLEGLEPGRRRLTIRCDGFSPCTGLVELGEGDLVQQRVGLCATARVVGRILRIDGRAGGHVEVTASAPGSLHGHATRCDADGRFELAELPAGDVRLVAETRDGDSPLRAETTLHLRAGETAVWQPTLAPVELIRGRLTGAGGAPLAGWRVEFADPRIETNLPQPVVTDEDGRYELPRLPTFRTTRLALFHPQVRHGVPTRVFERDLDDEGAGDLQLDEGEDEVSWAFGRVVRHDGAAASPQPLVIQRLSDRISVGLTLGEDGSFSSPPLPPGEYVAILPLHGRGWTADAAWSIDGHSPFDAGFVVLPETGELALLTSVDDRNAETRALRFDLLRPGVTPNFALPVMIGAFQAPLLLQVAPGDYRMSFPDEPELGCVEFTIESGETTPVELPASE